MPRKRMADLDLAALLCERWGAWIFEKGVRAHVPLVNRQGRLEAFAIVTPASLRALVKRLRAVGQVR